MAGIPSLILNVAFFNNTANLSNIIVWLFNIDCVWLTERLYVSPNVISSLGLAYSISRRILVVAAFFGICHNCDQS